MANPQIVVEMDADEAKMWQKFKRIENAEGGVENALKAIGRAGKQAAADQAGLERAAVRTLKSIETPQERYNLKIAELNRLYGASKLTVDQFRRALTQVREEYAKATGVAEENTGVMEEAADAGNRAFGSAMLSQVRGLLGALGLGGGLAGVLHLVNGEYEAIVERQAESARQSMTAADAQIKFVRNLQPETKAELEKAVADVEALSMETGVSVKDLYLRAGSAMSARGALSKEAAYKAVEASARLVPEDMGEGEDVAGAALDLMKVTGSEDAEAAVGFLMETVRRARLTRTGAVARNVVQPLIASMGRGDTEAEAAALFAAITTGAGDVRGEQSGTAMATLAQQLSEELPKLPSTRARIEAVQKSPQLQQKIIPELKGEAKTKGVMEQLLTGKGGISDAYQEYLATMPGIDESVESYRRLVGLIQGTEIQRTAKFGRTLETTAEQLATADQEGARIGLLREKFGPLLRQTGLGAIETSLAGLTSRASGDELEDFVRGLQVQETRLRYGREVYEARAVGVPSEPHRIAPTELEVKQADILKQLIGAAQAMKPEVPKTQEPKTEPGPTDLYREMLGQPPGEKAKLPADYGWTTSFAEARKGGAAGGALPVAPGPAAADLYRQERRLPATTERAAPAGDAETGGVRSPRSLGGPGPGDSTVTVVPVPAGEQKTAAADPQMERNNQLLQEISQKLNPKQPDRRPMPAATSAANTMNRE